MPRKEKKPPVWKQGADYVIANPPLKSDQWEEWKKVKEKYDES